MLFNSRRLRGDVARFNVGPPLTTGFDSTAIENPLAYTKRLPANCISLIFAIPMAINCAHFIARQLPELLQIKPEEGRPLRAVLARDRTWLANWPRISRTLSSGSVAGALWRRPATTGVRTARQRFWS